MKLKTEAFEALERLFTITYEHGLDEAINQGLQPRVYHYTNAAGLLGILTTRTLWATHFAYLGDHSEPTYGIKRIEKHLIRTKNPFKTAFLLGSPQNSIQTRFVACFCEQDDLLGQWRGFSQLHDGCAIEFDSRALALSSKSFGFIRLIYDPDAQDNHIAVAVSKATDLLKEYRHLNAKEFAVVEHAASGLVYLAAIALKAPPFQSEKEWRLVSYESNVSERFRLAQGQFIPYVPIPFRRSVITAIRQVPGQYRELNLEAIRRFATTQGFKTLSTAKSAIPM